MPSSKKTTIGRQLNALCRSAFDKLTSSTVNETKTRECLRIFTTYEGTRQLYTVIKLEDDDHVEQLKQAHEQAQSEGLKLEVESGELHEEHFVDQAIADYSDDEIERIKLSWLKSPKKATASSAIKLVIAYYLGAETMAQNGVTLKVNKFASADWDDVAKLRSDLEGATVSPAVKILRDRLRDLGEMFGSPKNLVEYQKALAKYRHLRSIGKDRDKCYTVTCPWGPSKVSWKDEYTLFALLLENLGKEYVVVKGPKVVVKGPKGEKTGHQSVYQSLLSPVGLAELIALKLALGIRHQAVSVDEIYAMEKHMRTIAEWLNRRVARPERGGDLHPDETCLPPDLRINQGWVDDMTEVAGSVRLNIQGRDILYTGGNAVAKWGKTWEETVKRRTLVAVRGKMVTTTKTVTDVDTQSIWFITKRTKNAWYIEKVTKDVESKRKITSTNIVGSSKVEKDGDIHFEKEHVYEEEDVVVTKSNIVHASIIENPPKDWEMFVSVKQPSLRTDRTLPMGDDGKFPKVYAGPSYVKIVPGADGKPLPTKPFRCEMCDGRLWAIWNADGKNGDCPTCHTSHILKTHIKKSLWAPKIKVVNERTDKNGDPYTTSCILHADKEFMSREKFCSKCRGWEGDCDCDKPWFKAKLRFKDGDMFMPLIVSEFQQYIMRCVWTNTYIAPPLLDVTYKEGELRGGNLKQQEELLRDIAALDNAGDPSAFAVREDLAALEKKRQGYSMRKAVLHVFIPYNPVLFEYDKKRPLDSLGLQVQIQGFYQHLVNICAANDGMLQWNEWEEADSGQWMHKRRKITHF